MTSVFVVLIGCGSGAPAVYPVSGRIDFQKGGDLKKLAGATVEFESVADPLIRAYGEIKDDGTFVMTTQTAGVAQVGAVAGEHRIRILFEVHQDKDEEEDEGTVRPPPKLPIHHRFTKFENSGFKCTVPISGELVLKVSR